MILRENNLGVICIVQLKKLKIPSIFNIFEPKKSFKFMRKDDGICVECK